MSNNTHWICIVFFFVLNFVGMIVLFRHDWNRITQLYRTYEPPPPNISWMESGSVGLIYYKEILNLGITRQEL